MATASAPAASAAAATNKNVLIPISNGTDEGHLGVIVSVLSRYKANIVIAAINNDPATSANKVFRSSGGLTITADETYENIKDACDWDLIVLPGGRRGAIAYWKHGELKEHIRQHVVTHKKLVGAIGESPAYVLAHIPQVLKDGHTCFPNKEYIQHVDGYAEGKSIVVKDNVVTCQGSGYAFPFAIQLAEMLLNITPVQAQLVANTLLVDRTLTSGVSYDPPRSDLDSITARMQGAAAKKAMEKQKQEYNARIRKYNEEWTQQTRNMSREEFVDSLPPGCRLVSKKNKNRRKRSSNKDGTTAGSQKKQRQTTSVRLTKIFQWTLWATLEKLKWRYVSRKYYVPPGEGPTESAITSQSGLVNHIESRPELSKNKAIEEGMRWFKSCLKYKQNEPHLDGKALFARALEDNPDLASGQFFEIIKSNMGDADSSLSVSPKESSERTSHFSTSSADQATGASPVSVHRAASAQQIREVAGLIADDDRKPSSVPAKSHTAPVPEEERVASAGNSTRNERLARREARSSRRTSTGTPSPNHRRESSSKRASAAASSGFAESPASQQERLAVSAGSTRSQQPSNSRISDEEIMLATIWEPLSALGWIHNPATKRDVYISPGTVPNAVGRGSFRSLDRLLEKVREEYTLDSNPVVAQSLEWYDKCQEVREKRTNEIPKDDPMKWLLDQAEKSESAVDFGPRPDSEEFRSLVNVLRSAKASSPIAAAASPAPGRGSKVLDVHEMKKPTTR